MSHRWPAPTYPSIPLAFPGAHATFLSFVLICILTTTTNATTTTNTTTNSTPHTNLLSSQHLPTPQHVHAT